MPGFLTSCGFDAKSETNSYWASSLHVNLRPFKWFYGSLNNWKLEKARPRKYGAWSNFPNRVSLRDLSSVELCEDGYYDGEWLRFCWLWKDFFVQSSFQTTKLIAAKIRGKCLIIVWQFVIVNSLNISTYTQKDLLWIKSTSRLLSRSVSPTNPLTTAFNVMIKDPFFNTSNKPIKKLPYCTLWLTTSNTLIQILSWHVLLI